MNRFLCRGVSVIVALAITLVLTFSASAADVSLSPADKNVISYGDWMLEKINGDTQFELDSYIGTDTDVITPRIIDNMLVVSFGNHCFMNNTTLKSIVTSSPLRVVGEYAFIDCTALESFVCNYALKEIGIGAFSGTSSLEFIDLENSVIDTVSALAFADSGIKEVELPSTCTSIDRYAFVRCGELTKITIPNNVTQIDDTAFDGCENLVIHAQPGSYAAEYAVAQGIPLAVEYLIGDSDGDGNVSILDATKIQRLLVDLETDPDGMMARRGDCNGDGLNIMDATKIQRYLAGYTVAESIGTTLTCTI